MTRQSILALTVTFLLVVFLTAISPNEKSLGVNVRLVYLHGAWVWTGLGLLLASGAFGLCALLIRRGALYIWSKVLAWTGLFFWITFLPMSLMVMQANWNGLFLQEPRFRISLNLAIIGLLLQGGLVLISHLSFSSLTNLVYGVAMFLSVSSARTVMHPSNPIGASDSPAIKFYFGALLILVIFLAVQIAHWLYQRERQRKSLIQSVP